jgi:predicted Zn finger-like uncharacterized protein
MDVTCTRCGTIYEFEEGLVSTTGTTVKCTQCGHLFKVHRSAAGSEPPPAEGESRELRWRVRRVNGSAHMLESLEELTPLITAGQFTPDDEISRTGQVWKKLGDIQELASLFEPAASTRPRRPSEFPGLPPPPATPSSEDEPASASTPPPPPPPAPPKPPAERIPRKRTRGAEARRAARAASRSVQPSAGDAKAAATPRSPHAEDELEAPMRTRSRLGLVILIGVPLLVAAAIAGALALRPSPAETPLVEQSARPFLQRGDEALASHLPARFDEAISEYTKALAFHPDDAHILSSLSRVYAVWSQWLGFRVRALVESGGAADQIEPLRSEARRLADQAKLYGERAAQRNPGNEEASVALSDALRLTGNLVAARAELDRARATEGVPSAETLRVAALLAIDEANGDVRAGRTLAEQAVASDPRMIRVRVLLALCLMAGGDAEGARMHLDAVQRGGAPHPVADEVRAEIARIELRQTKQHAEPEAKTEQPGPREDGTREDGKRESGKREDAKREDKRGEDPKRDGDAPGGSGRQGERDPDELVSKGESALERGAVQQAQQLFEDALAIRPGMARAKTGLGYVALERSQPRQAINHFRPAAKGGNPEALIGLGDAFRRLGRARDALDAYKEYMQRYPRGERRSIAQRQIELLTEQLESNP